MDICDAIHVRLVLPHQHWLSLYCKVCHIITNANNRHSLLFSFELLSFSCFASTSNTFEIALSKRTGDTWTSAACFPLTRGLRIHCGYTGRGYTADALRIHWSSCGFVLHNTLRHPPPIQSGVTSAINIADCIRFQSPFGSNPHSVIYMWNARRTYQWERP